MLSARTREEPRAGGLWVHGSLRHRDLALVRGARRRLPGADTSTFEKVLDLSYGENPHQRAAYYAEIGTRTHLLSMVSKLHGKELSFNNLLDLDAGRRLLEDRASGRRDHQAQQPLRPGARRAPDRGLRWRARHRPERPAASAA